MVLGNRPQSCGWPAYPLRAHRRREQTREVILEREKRRHRSGGRGAIRRAKLLHKLFPYIAIAVMVILAGILCYCVVGSLER